MARPHIEFIQSQHLPWQAEPLLPGAWCRVLSTDDTTGACTLLSRLDPGLNFARGSPIAADEEFYVLSGCYYLNGLEYAAGCYGYYPAGHPRRDAYSPEGAVILRFFDATPRRMAPDEPAPADRPTAQPFVDAFRMLWDRSVFDHRLDHLAPARKILRIDPLTGQKTFLFMTAPQSHPTNWRGPLEHHPTPEEAYLLAGDLTGPCGTLRPGAYFWRPPGIPHGPFGSRGGSLSLIRFVGGAHINHWSAESHPFSYAQPYRPVLPPALAALARAPDPVEAAW
jgi:hypothetical protein